MFRIHWLTALLCGVALGLIAAAVWLSILDGITAESYQAIFPMLMTAFVISAIANVFATVVSRPGSKFASRK
jgi:Sec-independent protein secretion pathway component TatC